MTDNLSSLQDAPAVEHLIHVYPEYVTIDDLAWMEDRSTDEKVHTKQHQTLSA